METDKTVALSYDKYSLKTPSPFCTRINVSICDPDFPYRTFDGSCNNLNQTWWGKAGTPFKRLLPAEYDDYVTAPRIRSTNGEKLPNPRSLAMNLFSAQKSISEWTSFMTYFGQFVDHDISLTEFSGYSDGYRKICPCGTYDPDCFNIDLPQSDYANKDQKCMSFVRSSPSVRDFDCNLGPREQLNTQTVWLDQSLLYGSNDSLSAQIRGNDGLLKNQVFGNGDVLLPLLSNTTCKPMRGFDYSRRTRCYISGK